MGAVKRELHQIARELGLRPTDPRVHKVFDKRLRDKMGKELYRSLKQKRKEVNQYAFLG